MHVFAVSGLHVAVVSGLLWYLGVLIGLRPRHSRTLLCLLLPFYALMAGASPSALRATLMIVVYLAARQLGRAVYPIAALLVAAAVLVPDPVPAPAPSPEVVPPLDSGGGCTAARTDAPFDPSLLVLVALGAMGLRARKFAALKSQREP